MVCVITTVVTWLLLLLYYLSHINVAHISPKCVIQTNFDATLSFIIDFSVFISYLVTSRHVQLRQIYSIKL